MMFVVMSNDKPGHLDLRLEVRPRHLEYLEGLKARGLLKMAGPFLDADGRPCGTLAVFEAETREQVEGFLVNDPYTQAGLFQIVEIRAFNWTVNKPAV